MASINSEYLNEHKLFRIRNKKIAFMFPLIAVLVAIIVFWCLKLIGITVTGDALCGVEEHVHTDDCYSQSVANGSDTTEASEKTLICTIPEHTHSSECFPDKNADIETANDWVKTFEKVELTNDVAENLYQIAATQLGYTESTLNYEYDSNAEKHGYTRYGEWYGAPYSNWNTMFVSFCINYANINGSDKLINASAEGMRLAWQEKRIYETADDYKCSHGDVVFFDTDSDGKADRTGIAVYTTEDSVMTIEGDVDGKVDNVICENTDIIMGYGKTSELYAAEHFTENIAGQSENEVEIPSDISDDVSGELNLYIPDEENAADIPNVFNSDPLVLMSEDDHDIIYTSHLEDEVVNAVFKDQSGEIVGDGDTVYIGETYVVSIEFSEINTGSEWMQFRHENGYLTYHVPPGLDCEPFDSWHTISATTEFGTIEDVGEYFLDETGLLRVRFFDDNGVNFVDKYSNVDFSIDFNVTVASSQSGSTTEIVFNDNINVQLNVDGGANMHVTKTHAEYESATNTLEYTIKVEAVHGVVHNLFLADDIWENHHALRDTIVVTDLDGNILNPQPVIGDNPTAGANYGFSLSGFPDFAAGEGFLIKYKSAINDNLLSNEKVDMWNGVNLSGNDSDGNPIVDPPDNSDPWKNWGEDWLQVELEKMVKSGNQSTVTTADGTQISAIEWKIGIRKTDANLRGTVVVDTLGEGLQYFTGHPITVKCYDEWGNYLGDTKISWDDVTITGNSMEFALPDAFACDIIYYTTFEELDAGEEKSYSNRAKVTINGKEESTQGTANVVGFMPHVEKHASGDDGEYVNFTIIADVPAVIKDWGSFYLTDLTAFWNYTNNDYGYTYVNNLPEDMVITAETASGQIITFTPYTAGGTIENTYMLITPVNDGNGDMYHTFKVLFNTAYNDNASSKWILNEDAVLTISYKLSFDRNTGVDWYGELKDDVTVEDGLLSGNTLANEVYFNYTNTILENATATYKYSPMLIKKSYPHEDGTIDYTVTFNNTIPGTTAAGYINNSIAQAWFNDTFDERMEYVQDSLIVTCYSPWDPNLWIRKYQYKGTVNGNTINVSASDMVSYDYNENAPYNDWAYTQGAYTFNDYYHWVDSGGKFVYTYSLKLKDEYLYTNEHAQIELDNTAEVTWSGDGSSGPATETTQFVTGLVEKTVVQKDTKLDFDIHINRNALDILPGADNLIIEDTMTPNLSVYWRSIVLLYQNTDGSWIDFSAPESKYTYNVTFDPPTNKLTFIIPDELHIRIDYTTLITESGMVSVNNSVSINGKAEVTDFVDALFRVEEHSGGASGSNHEIMLLKQDGMTDEPLPGATFALYGLKGDNSAVIPNGVSPTVITEDGMVLKYIGSYTTGDIGTVLIESQYLTIGGPYALVEYIAPEGYTLPDKPVYFYFYDTDPDGIIQSVTTLIVVENFNGGFLIPETGGFGVLPTAIIGIALVAIPVLYSSIRRKRERRLS